MHEKSEICIIQLTQKTTQHANTLRTQDQTVSTRICCLQDPLGNETCLAQNAPVQASNTSWLLQSPRSAQQGRPWQQCDYISQNTEMTSQVQNCDAAKNKLTSEAGSCLKDNVALAGKKGECDGETAELKRTIDEYSSNCDKDHSQLTDQVQTCSNEKTVCQSNLLTCNKARTDLKLERATKRRQN